MGGTCDRIFRPHAASPSRERVSGGPDLQAQSGLFFVFLHELSTASKQQTNTIMAEFIYQEPFPIQDDKTKYRLLTKEYVKVVECDGRKILKVDPKGLELLSKEGLWYPRSNW